MPLHLRIGSIAAAVGLMGLAACEPVPVEPTAKPRTRPASLTTAAPVAAEPSAQSEELAYYYLRLQQNLLAQGLMRTDGGGVDTYYSDTMLARNFEQITFYGEYTRAAGVEPSGGLELGLQKWEKPVRISVEFGSTVPPEARQNDLQTVQNYVRRLSRITNHPISVGKPANLQIFVMGLDDRELLAQRLQQVATRANAEAVLQFLDRNRSAYCIVVSTSNQTGSYALSSGYVIIRSELPAQMRKSCFHEEIAQALGLGNDSQYARPSIFNDDDEFALLTTHDEMLLRILYDPALKPGMTLEQARPIIRQIIAGRTGPS